MSDQSAQIVQVITTMIRLSDKKYLSQDEAVAYTSLSEDSIQRATRSGELKAKLFGRKPLYQVKWLDEWMDGFPSWEPRGSR